MLKTRDIPDVEILSVGTWHGTGCPPAGCQFTEDDLDEIVATYDATKGVLSPPLKLGHDDNQKLLQADGYPAAGWLANIRRDGKKLLADLMKVPAKIADLIDVGAYRNRSVELDANYEIAGTKYAVALTGMALLGADLPAVENLADITALYERQKLSLPNSTRAVVFSAAPKIDFALPAGMSYDDLCQALRMAFVSANPGASDDDVWVADVFDDSAIFSMGGRFWQQSYTVNRNGSASMTGQPAQVARVTEWRALHRNADDAEHVLASVQAFVERTEQLVTLRAKDGRTIAKAQMARLASLRDGLCDAKATLDRVLDETPPSPPAEKQPDYGPLMRARLRQAELREAELAGVTT